MTTAGALVHFSPGAVLALTSPCGARETGMPVTCGNRDGLDTDGGLMPVTIIPAPHHGRLDPMPWWEP